MQKLEKILFLLVLLSLIPNAKAQQAIVISGENASGTGGTSSYSVGQVAYINATGAGGSINQGAQQPFEIVTLGTDNFPQISLQMSVHPNPTSSYVNLKIENYDYQNLQYILFDGIGREISNQKIKDSETQIDMQNLSVALYLLKVMDEGKILKTFKIIKNQ